MENRRIEATQTQLLLTPPPTGVLRPGGLMPEMEAGDEGLGSRRGHPQIPAGVAEAVQEHIFESSSPISSAKFETDVAYPFVIYY